MIHGFSPTMIYDAAQVSEMDIKKHFKFLKAGLDSFLELLQKF